VFGGEAQQLSIIVAQTLGATIVPGGRVGAGLGHRSPIPSLGFSG
jgi:hypothetical protein